MDAAFEKPVLDMEVFFELFKNLRPVFGAVLMLKDVIGDVFAGLPVDAHTFVLNCGLTFD